MYAIANRHRNRTKCNRLIALQIAHGIHNIQRNFARIVDTQCENKLFASVFVFFLCSSFFNSNKCQIRIFWWENYRKQFGCPFNAFHCLFFFFRFVSFQSKWFPVWFGCRIFFGKQGVQLPITIQMKAFAFDKWQGSLLIAQSMLDWNIFRWPRPSVRCSSLWTVLRCSVVAICCFWAYF